MDNLFMVFKILGGLGIFLFGLKFLGDGLKDLAGSRLRDIIDKYTTNPISGALVGIVVTMLLQSSSGTTALVVGLVAAGIMTLRQSIAVIIGANVGTTITALLIAFEGMEFMKTYKVSNFSPLLLAVGALLILFFNRKKFKLIGQVLFGFGALFFGLSYMGAPLKELSKTDAFQNLIMNFVSNPFFGVIGGIIMTVAVQSSSATIAILQTFYAEGAFSGGVFELKESLTVALPILIGDNIGTTITAVLAALGASRLAKRTALAHVFFNVAGAIIFLIILIPFREVVMMIIKGLGIVDSNHEMHIFIAHMLFNLTMLLIALPFTKHIAWIVTKLIPVTAEEKEMQVDDYNITPELLESSPAIALTQVGTYIHGMGKATLKAVNSFDAYLNNKEIKYYKRAIDLEVIINDMNNKIEKDLLELTKHSLNVSDSHLHNKYLHMIKDFERIGDHIENLAEYFNLIYTSKDKLNNSFLDEVKNMTKVVVGMVDNAIEAIFDDNLELAQKVLEIEKTVDQLEMEYRKNHVKRLKMREINATTQNVLFVDILSNLERIADHANNLAEYTINLEA